MHGVALDALDELGRAEARVPVMQVAGDPGAVGLVVVVDLARLGLKPLHLGLDLREAFGRHEVGVGRDGPVGQVLEGFPALTLANECNAHKKSNAGKPFRFRAAPNPHVISTTTRPRIRPARISSARVPTSRRLTRVVIAARCSASRPRARWAQAARRFERRVVTLLMPSSETPRRMKGATEAGRSMPCARPQAAIAPSARVIARRLARVAEPTASIPAAQRSLARGRGVPDRSARSMISAAPRPRRDPASAGRN